MFRYGHGTLCEVTSPQRSRYHHYCIIGVYLPCSDMGMERYTEHLIELERVVSEHQHSGPVVIMGDFNAHLGVLGGVRGIGEPNQQGVLLHQLITHCNLYAVSLSSLSQGPQYTFQNSLSQTTVDYILVSHDTTEYVLQCFTHDHAPLNNSDHLPITATLQFSHSTAIPQEQLTKNRIHWARLSKTHICVAIRRVYHLLWPLSSVDRIALLRR